jgi:hypothetical protein
MLTCLTCPNQVLQNRSSFTKKIQNSKMDEIRRHLVSCTVLYGLTIIVVTGQKMMKKGKVIKK